MNFPKRWTRIVLLGVFAALGAWIVWLFYCFTPQINASIRAQIASHEVVEKSVAGERPRGIETRDFWNRPFYYATEGKCFVLISYGSDGVPDADYDVAALCRSAYERRSSCDWPTIDTVFVNGSERVYCLK